MLRQLYLKCVLHLTQAAVNFDKYMEPVTTGEGMKFCFTVKQ